MPRYGHSGLREAAERAERVEALAEPSLESDRLLAVQQAGEHGGEKGRGGELPPPPRDRGPF